MNITVVTRKFPQLLLLTMQYELMEEDTLENSYGSYHSQTKEVIEDSAERLAVATRTCRVYHHEIMMHTCPNMQIIVTTMRLLNCVIAKLYILRLHGLC